MKKYYLILLFLGLGTSFVLAQNNAWCVVISQKNIGQTYTGSELFPTEFVSQQKAKGNYITDITYGNKEWVVTTGQTTYTEQVYLQSKTFPATWIEEQWNKGYDMTKIAYGQNQWVVVLSKNAGLTAESWGKHSSFAKIREFIKAKWNDQKDIINLTYGNGTWIANLAKGTNYTAQTYNWGTEFPQKWVNEQYAKGYNITSLAYGQGFWVVVLSQYANPPKGTYIYTKEFPSQWIKQQWDLGYRLQTMHYNYKAGVSSSFEEYLNAGIKANNAQEYDLAISYYTKALNLKPNHATTYHHRAWAKYQNNQCHGALTDVNQAIQLEANANNYHSRGAIYLCLDRCRDALNDFSTAIESHTEPQAIFYADRALAKSCLGNIEDAIADYNTAILLSPNDAVAYQAEKEALKKLQIKKTPPTITWDYPYNAFVSTTESSHQLKICIHSEEEIKGINFLINGKTFTSRGFGIEEDCTAAINQSIQLQEGKNVIEIEVKTAHHTTLSEKRTIEYKAESSGSYHALLIGVENYDDLAINDLNKPIDDAEQLANILQEKYTFEANDIHLLKNPTKDDIINKLIYLQERLSEKDNLLIFYSGHGVVKNEIGYWLPKDADKNQRAKWFSNSELRDYINSIKTKHTLVIADACFAGSIFTGGYRDITEFACAEMEKIPSRRAMTSGANTVVPDNSIFFKYLIKKLKDNEISCLSAETLYSKVKPAVIYNSPNNHIPQFGVLPQTGDEGGNFIFRTQ